MPAAKKDCASWTSAAICSADLISVPEVPLFESRQKTDCFVAFGSLLNIEIVCVCASVRLCVCVCSVLTRERINRFAPNLACLFLKTRNKTQKGQNSGKMSRVRVPVRAVPVARKLSTTEERRQDQSCLFRGGDWRTKITTSKICPGFQSQWRWFL
jgi:hypothetical protein